MKDGACAAGHLVTARQWAMWAALALGAALAHAPASAQKKFVYMTPDTWVSCSKLKQWAATSITGRKVLGAAVPLCANRDDKEVLTLNTRRIKELNDAASEEASESSEAANDYNRFQGELANEHQAHIERHAKALLARANEPFKAILALKTDVERVNTFFNVMYPAAASPEIGHKLERRILAQYQEGDPKAVQQAGKVILTCADIASFMSRLQVESAVAMEPVFQSCYQAPFSAIEILPADLHAKLSAAGIAESQAQGLVQAGTMKLAEAISLRNRQIALDHKTAEKEARAAKAAQQAEDRAVRLREEAAEQERARQKRAAAEAAEAARWAALTPEQRAAENRATELANHKAKVAQCAMWKEMLDFSVSRGEGLRAEQIATRMRLECR